MIGYVYLTNIISYNNPNIY